MIILGDCLEELKKLPDNSVDSVVTDPPYGLSFMGKKWDYDVPSIEIWTECLRVLKPGGYLLAFAGTRTQHRMAVRIEDAGFEIRDMIAWVYGSGFPKSLNIGKAVDKLQGNERERILVPSKAGNSIRRGEGEQGTTYGDAHGGFTDIGKGTSEWEGWGTALKPALEPITVARKPLSDGGLDIAKTICYNIRENSLSTNQNILWRIKPAKSVAKQKTTKTSSSTEPQKTVVVSVKTVSENEKQDLGKRIEKLYEKMREDTDKIIELNSTKTAGSVMEQTENEYLQTVGHINESEKNLLLKHTEENANVVEKQDLNFLPLTTKMEEEDNTENLSKTQTSIYSSKKQDTQKTDTDYSVATATSHWVCMDIVRTIKISFNNKEYDFDELSDGSFVWNDELKPFQEPKPLNVAENCLKWGVGGINIDGCRVGTDKIIINGGGGGEGTGWGKKEEINEERIGRFPANLIHDGSPEVLSLFPNTKSGKLKSDCYKNDRENDSMFAGCGKFEHKGYEADSGSASRFFQKCEMVDKDISFMIELSICGTILENQKAGITLFGVIKEVEKLTQSVEQFLCGKKSMENFQKDFVFTIRMVIKQMIELITLLALPLQNITTFTEESEKTIKWLEELNIDTVLNVENINRLITFKNEVQELIRDTVRTVSVKDLKSGEIKTENGTTNITENIARIIYSPKASKSERNRGCEGFEEKEGIRTNAPRENEDIKTPKRTNNHPTVKPVALMRYLCKLVTPPKGTVLDPFAGSGSTGVAAKEEGFEFIGIEREPGYVKIAEARIDACLPANQMLS